MVITSEALVAFSFLSQQKLGEVTPGSSTHHDTHEFNIVAVSHIRQQAPVTLFSTDTTGEVGQSSS